MSENNYFWQQLKLELNRTYQNPTNRIWLFIYILLLSIYNSFSVISSTALANFLPITNVLINLSRVQILVQIQSLPILVLILTYNSLIEDKMLGHFSVASVNRKSWLYSKLVYIYVISYAVFFVVFTITHLIIFIIYTERLYNLTLFILGLLAFSLFLLLLVPLVSNMVIRIYQNTRNHLVTIVIPVIFIYIIPSLITSSLNFQVLNPQVLLISPISWFDNFIGSIVFTEIFKIQGLLLIGFGLFSLVDFHRNIKNMEFE